MADLRLPLSRRGLLKRSPLFLGTAVLASCRRPSVASRQPEGLTENTSQAIVPTKPGGNRLTPTPACGDSPITLEQTPGPFYSPNSPRRRSLLEANLPGHRLMLSGQVLTTDCQPVANCLVDFWQTNREGNYDNQGYRLRGHQFTDSDGRYALETIVPGIYPGRTRHIHVRVQPDNGPILTTQLYLPNEPLNQEDFLFQPELLMSMPESEGHDGGSQARFDFVVEISG